MNETVFEVALLDGSGRRAKVMPLLGSIELGHRDDADWVLPVEVADGQAVRLVRAGDGVLVQPLGAGVFVEGRLRRRSIRTCTPPFSFSVGSARFQVRPCRSRADGAPAPEASFDHLVSADPGAGESRPEPSRRVHRPAFRAADRDWLDRLGGRGARIAGAAAGVLLAATAGIAVVVTASGVSARPAPAAAPRTVTGLHGAPLVAPPSVARQEPAFDGPEALRSRVEALLRTASAGPGVGVEVGAGRVSIVGESSPDEIERLTRIVARASRNDPALSEVRVAITTRERAAELPFKVEQVAGGASPFVVLDDGVTLEPGQQHEGVTLVAIQGHRIVFQGSRRFEVEW